MSAPLGALALAGLLIAPGLGVPLLAAVSNYRLSASINVALCAVTLFCAGLLYSHRPEPTLYLLVDDVNTVFLIVGALVGFTTSVFSAGYIAHELEARRLKRRDLRFYHAMYQLLMLAMNVALVSNNIGLMWVAIEVATLTTVVMVGIYRTNAALEAAWKYFILGSVGIALALFGTILVYLAAQERLGQGIMAMAWDRLVPASAAFDPALYHLGLLSLERADLGRAREYFRAASEANPGERRYKAALAAKKSPEQALKEFVLPENLKAKGFTQPAAGRGGAGGNFTIIMDELQGK